MGLVALGLGLGGKPFGVGLRLGDALLGICFGSLLSTSSRFFGGLLRLRQPLRGTTIGFGLGFGQSLGCALLGHVETFLGLTLSFFARLGDPRVGFALQRGDALGRCSAFALDLVGDSVCLLTSRVDPLLCGSFCGSQLGLKRLTLLGLVDSDALNGLSSLASRLVHEARCLGSCSRDTLLGGRTGRRKLLRKGLVGTS